jgi:hypothetical protein
MKLELLRFLRRSDQRKLAGQFPPAQKGRSRRDWDDPEIKLIPRPSPDLLAKEEDAYATATD